MNKVAMKILQGSVVTQIVLAGPLQLHILRCKFPIQCTVYVIKIMKIG